MKKLTTFLFTIAAVFTLAACSNSNAGQHNSNNQSAIAKTRTIKKVSMGCLVAIRRKNILLIMLKNLAQLTASLVLMLVKTAR